MTNKERVLAIMAGRSPDRIPWIPRLGVWYEAHKHRGTLPARFQGMTLAEAEREFGMGAGARAFGNKVIIWEGLPSVLLCDPVTDEEFEAYMASLFRMIGPGDAFILGVSDNIMMESKVERLDRVAEMVEAWGSYPIDPTRVGL